ncbi:MAG: hypothetical protein K9M10_02975 [Candidatus Pacebacteria bacterium]|nr:hypothetical protein [Candidatus Paceibacterota bacterium]
MNKNSAVKIANAGWVECNGSFTIFLTASQRTWGTTVSGWIAKLNDRLYGISEEALFILEKVGPVLNPPCYTGVTIVTERVQGSGISMEEATLVSSSLGLRSLPAICACLLREGVCDSLMSKRGITRIVVMHEPIQDSAGILCRLSLFFDGEGSWLDVFYDGDDEEWLHQDIAFAYSGFPN